MTNTPSPDTAGEREASRAAALTPEEEAAGSDDHQAQAAAVLDDSDRRSQDRNAAPGSRVEHRRSDET